MMARGDGIVLAAREEVIVLCLSRPASQSASQSYGVALLSRRRQRRLRLARSDAASTTSRRAPRRRCGRRLSSLITEAALFKIGLATLRVLVDIDDDDDVDVDDLLS